MHYEILSSCLAPLHSENNALSTKHQTCKMNRKKPQNQQGARGSFAFIHEIYKQVM